MSDQTIRLATPNDLAEIRRLVHGLADYERMLDRFTATEQDFERILFGPDRLGSALLAEIEGRAVGIAIWYYILSTFAARPVLFLEDIFVEPEYRGQGVGLALLRQLARVARDRNCLSMEWNVLTWNAPAIAFYERIGARPVTDWTVYRLPASSFGSLADE